MRTPGILAALLLTAAAGLLLTSSCGSNSVISANSLIRISNATEPLELARGESFQLEVTQFFRREDRRGGFVDSLNVTPLLEYASSDPDVVTITNQGRLTAVGPGVAEIEAKLSRTLARDDIDRLTVVVNQPGTAPAPLASDYRFPDRIRVSWTEPPSSVTQVRVHRTTNSNDDNPPVHETLPGDSTGFTDLEVEPGQVYFYSISFSFPGDATERSPADSGIAGDPPESPE